MSGNWTPGPWRNDGDAVINHKGFIVADKGITNWENNAHLIAAAPELYEALDALVNEPTNAPDYLPSRLWDNARKALRKARGEA